jgi:multiple sugar transport system permease protein
MKLARIINFGAFLLLGLGSLTMLLPFFWMISTSLKDRMAVYKLPLQWLPNPVHWDKYAEIWSKAALLDGVRNSAIVAISVIVVGAFTTSLGAFAFSKMKFPGKNGLFLILLTTLVIPFPVVLIPQFFLYSKLGWLNTLLPLMIPPMLGNVFMMFFLRQFMNGISDELVEAGKLDGCGWFRIFRSILLPICRPAIAAHVILWFMNIWNDYIAPLIFIHDTKWMTIQLMIRSFNAFYSIQNDYPLIMAAAVVALLPVIVAFLLFQRYLTETMAFTGVKG